VATSRTKQSAHPRLIPCMSLCCPLPRLRSPSACLRRITIFGNWSGTTRLDRPPELTRRWASDSAEKAARAELLVNAAHAASNSIKRALCKARGGPRLVTLAQSRLFESLPSSPPAALRLPGDGQSAGSKPKAFCLVIRFALQTSSAGR